MDNNSYGGTVATNAFTGIKLEPQKKVASNKAQSAIDDFDGFT